MAAEHIPRLIQFRNKVYMSEPGKSGKLHQVAAPNSAFRFAGSIYCIGDDRRLWKFFDDAVSALGAEGAGLIDMPKGHKTTSFLAEAPGGGSGMWCRLSKTADREILMDYLVQTRANQGRVN